jgi:hypothetical protein
VGIAQANNSRSAGEMHKRRTTLEDGRYLIFYTFDGEETAPRADNMDSERSEVAPESEALTEPKAESEVASEAEEERSV